MKLRFFMRFLIAGPIAAAMAVATTAAEPPMRTIKVSAMREIQVVPDEVVLSFSVVTKDEKSPLPAKSENDNRTRAILRMTNRHRIEDKYVKIDCLEIQPVYMRGEFQHYSVTRGIDITLQDFNLLEPILADALALGADRVSGILFRTTKHREHQFETRRLAVMYAKEKAGHLAELNGLALGKAITIEEEVEGDVHTRGLGFGGGMGGMAGDPSEGTSRPRVILVGMGKDRPETEGADQTTRNARETVAPGTISVSATVTITFELKEPKQP